MYLTPRAAWLAALGLLAVVLVPRAATVVVWAVVWAVVIAVDVAAAPSPRALRARRVVARSVRLGETTTSAVTLTSSSSRPMAVLVRDAWPPSAGAVPGRPSLRLAAHGSARVRTALTPSRRGDRSADLVTVRVPGPLRMAGRQASLDAPARVRVLPAFSSRRHLPSRLARLREMDGRSAVMVRGQGTEFDSLRQYVVGDDVRSIDWRSTARRGEVLVRTWRPERDRRVLLLVDSGRASAVRLGEDPRLDAQIEACLLMAALASRAGDRVDVLALDVALRAQVRGQSGPGLMSALADGLAPLEPSLVETDWSLAASLVRRTLSHRSLVVLLTGLDSLGEVDVQRALAAMARDHALLVGAATDPELDVLRRDRAQAEAVYTAAAAETDVLALDATRARLRRAGIEVVEAGPGSLAPALADAYLALKAAGRL